jgi:hypothetical protein
MYSNYCLLCDLQLTSDILYIQWRNIVWVATYQRHYPFILDRESRYEYLVPLSIAFIWHLLK